MHGCNFCWILISKTRFLLVNEGVSYIAGGTAVLFTYIYEELKRRVPEEHQNSVMLHLSCGALDGLFRQTFTYPLDVVRRQMQVQSLQTGGPGYRNTIEGFTTIIRNQGWGQLFAGLSIHYMKIIPLVAIGFIAYDMMKSWLRVPPRKKNSISTHCMIPEFPRLHQNV